MLAGGKRQDVLKKATGQDFDIIVVGGGITGSGIVRDAQSRGLKTLLLEKSDFASGTSSKSGKLVHGGLRYLNYGQFRMVYEACSERHHLRKTLAPHIVRPVPFLLSFYPFSKPGRLKVAAGLFLYDLLSLFRNIRRFRILSSSELARLEPGMEKAGCKGGLQFFDCMSLDFRLTIDTLKSADESGASLLNYCKVTGLAESTESGGFHTIHFHDELTRTKRSARGRVIINASGAWADELLDVFGTSERFGMKISRGIHVVLDNRVAGISHAIGFHDSHNKRQIYAVPWGDRLLLGTTDEFYRASKDNIPVTQEDINYLFSSFERIFPKARISRSDIISIYAGIRPLIGSESEKSESELSRDFSIRIRAEGLVSITGGKLTTYRLMAESLMNQVCKHFFPSQQKLAGKTLCPLSGGQENSADFFPAAGPGKSIHPDLSDETCKHLKEFYGSNARYIISYAAKYPEDARLISSYSPHIRAEIRYAVNHEFVATLQDVLMRRTTIYMFARDNGLSCCQDVAEYLAVLLGWSTERITEEVRNYRLQVQHMRLLAEGKGGSLQ